MSLNVSYNQIVDAAALKDVTKQIFERANSQNASSSALANADLSKFNRVSLGTSLYNVSASQSSQIAMANAGVNVNLSEKAIQSLRYLNNQASKSIFNAVDGKVVIPVQTAEHKDNVVKLPTFGRLVETAEVGADKKGSNPFFNGQTNNSKKEDDLNIFA